MRCVGYLIFVFSCIFSYLTVADDLDKLYIVDGVISAKRGEDLDLGCPRPWNPQREQISPKAGVQRIDQLEELVICSGFGFEVEYQRVDQQGRVIDSIVVRESGADGTVSPAGLSGPTVIQVKSWEGVNYLMDELDVFFDASGKGYLPLAYLHSTLGLAELSQLAEPVNLAGLIPNYLEETARKFNVCEHKNSLSPDILRLMEESWDTHIKVGDWYCLNDLIPIEKIDFED